MVIQPFPMCCGAYTISNWDAILSGAHIKEQIEYYERLIKANLTMIEGRGREPRVVEAYTGYNRGYEDMIKKLQSQISEDPYKNAREFLDKHLFNTGAFITTMSADQYKAYEPLMTDYGFNVIEAGNPVHSLAPFYVLVKIVNKAR